MRLFNPGSELANLTVTSGVLQLLLNSVNGDEQSSSSSCSELQSGVSKLPNGSMAVTFSTSPDFAIRKLREGSELVSSSSSIAKRSFDLFGFLRGKTDFAINRAAITLFDDNLHRLSELKNQISNVIMDKSHSSPVIVSGNSLGGAIASIFTLWLLESVDFSNKKRPICITFGSPLLGDANLQNALSKYSPWCSCFLHVASTRDSIPSMFTAENAYKPFGTFLLCSESGCSCFDEPQTVLHLLSKSAMRDEDLHHIVDYRKIVDGLKCKALFKNTAETDWRKSPYQLGIATELAALDLGETEIKTLVESIEKSVMKFQMGKRTVNPDKKLNNAKIHMAKVEWYMKSSNDIGYYDSFKAKRFPRDIHVEEYVKRLMNYWSDLVEEADMKPQTETETFRMRFLFSGLNYMRLVEPLYIADFYHERRRSDYKIRARPRHFVRLEAMVAEAKKKEIDENAKNKKFSASIDSKRKNVRSILTEDSCFWAAVEEARVTCRAMKREGASDGEKRAFMNDLRRFEVYVLKVVKDYAVSPEIFLPESSFMKWWNDYNDLLESVTRHESATSVLKEIMEIDIYRRYTEGKL